MRHGFKKRTLNKKIAHRRAMFANLCLALIKHEQIKTTLPKAKELSPIFEKLVTKAEDGTLHARRQILSFLRDTAMTEKLMTTLVKRYEKRNGGYVRVLKAGFRFGDCAPMAIVELVDRDVTAKGQDSGKIVEVEAEPETPAEDKKTTAPKAEKVTKVHKEKAAKVNTKAAGKTQVVRRANMGGGS
ncbi:MAG: 50S ribosomal protein L17 [Alphaproteobacteria bacterium]|nr:50S ribosomal protein L17 [Alphaproteobacteria bacterium]